MNKLTATIVVLLLCLAGTAVTAQERGHVGYESFYGPNASYNENMGSRNGTKPHDAPAPTAIDYVTNPWSLRTNALYWAAAAPNIGVSYRAGYDVELKLDTWFSAWKLKGGDKRYGQFFINPELRYFVDVERKFYVGLAGTVGYANLKLNDTGRKGDIYAIGASLGYQLFTKGRMYIDFNLGLGVIHFRYKTYETLDGKEIKPEVDPDLPEVKEKKHIKNWWGPTQLQVALCWRLGK